MLSHSEKFTVSQINGFPKKEKKLEKKIQTEEQIYESLRNYYSDSIYSPGRKDLRSPVREMETNEKEKEDIYDDIY